MPLFHPQDKCRLGDLTWLLSEETREEGDDILSDIVGPVIAWGNALLPSSRGRWLANAMSGSWPQGVCSPPVAIPRVHGSRLHNFEVQSNIYTCLLLGQSLDGEYH